MRRAAAWLRSAVADLFNGGASKRFALIAIALGLGLVGGIWFMLDVLPDLAVDGDGLKANDRLQRENDVRTTGLQALAGFVLAIGGAFTAYSVLSNREDQLDERFARSLELMASDDSHVVSGAVFSLERIAVQSRFDRDAVVDVLCGFLREREATEKPPPEAVQALRVLCRVKELWGSPTPDLRETDWSRARLDDLDLGGIVLTNAVFARASLFGAKFGDANLIGANFTDATLIVADFAGANLGRANLSSAMLGGAELKGVNLKNATLTGAFLGKTTRLAGANLAGVKLDHAWIEGTDLSQVENLEEAETTGARYEPETRFPDGFDPAERGMTPLDRR